jgi:hypothetical protein
MSASVDVDDVIQCGRETLHLLPVDHISRAAFLSDLATLLFGRFEQLGGIEELEEAITYNREALALTPLKNADDSCKR